MQLPYISLAKLTATASMPSEVGRLRDACTRFGFFYLVDHGVDPKRVQKAMVASRRFFSLPEAVKSQYGHQAQSVWPAACRGYVPLLGETLHREAGADPKEIFDLGIESDDFRRPFSGRTNFPDDSIAPAFSRALLALQQTLLAAVIPAVGRALSTMLSLDPDWYDHHFTPPTLIQRVVRYPANHGTAGRHTDNGMFTILIQEELETESLRVLLNNTWVPVPSPPGTFTVNLGDMLQMMSDGWLKSTPHEVIHNAPRDRISLPFFVYPNVDAVIPSKCQSRSLDVRAIMLSNYASIWEAKTGAGRSQEL